MTGCYNRLLEAREKYGDRIVACDGKEKLTYTGLLAAAKQYGAPLHPIRLMRGKELRAGRAAQQLRADRCRTGR